MTIKKTIALVGATGHLGGLIAHELLTVPTVDLRILVRPSSRSRAANLEVAGAEIIEGDLSDEDALAALTRDAYTVISAVQGGPETIIDAQRRLLAAARTSGARRFIPSDFSLDMFTVPEGGIVTADMRRTFAHIADAERGDVEVVHILIGGFLDRGVLFGFIRVIDAQAKTAYVWGDGHPQRTGPRTSTPPATPLRLRWMTTKSALYSARPATLSTSPVSSPRTKRPAAQSSPSRDSAHWRTSMRALMSCGQHPTPTFAPTFRSCTTVPSFAARASSIRR